MTAPRALIAEDEPLLAAALEQELARAWPELAIAVRVGDGLSAVRQALALLPDILFLDIRMPGCSGLEAALELADAWPQGQPLPALVFVTAYDQYAVQAFEAQAVDYLLKPVQPERLRKSVARLRQALAQRGQSWAQEQTLAQLRQLVQAPGLGLAQAAAAQPLTVIQASSGNQIHMVALAEVLYFEAADKYLRVLTARQ
ncbi:MAG TPA: LytTR family DNA-binding domain-containing protein, partial [Alicycliphilus sp.]|nr:LytTR family DNA-binding domain-containing protein [Alicycliphilus sp.]